MIAAYDMHAERRTVAGIVGHVPFDVAIERVRKRKGAGADVPASIVESWTCDYIGVTPIELGMMSDDEVAEHVGYRMGVELARAHSQMKEGVNDG